MYWRPESVLVPAASFQAGVRPATAGDRWVADGNYSVIRALLWSRATHIVWLDFGRGIVYSRMLHRTMQRLLLRTRLSHGNRESFRLTFLSRDSILRWTVATFARNRRTYNPLRAGQRHAHLPWAEITRLSHAHHALVTLASHVNGPARQSST